MFIVIHPLHPIPSRAFIAFLAAATPLTALAGASPPLAQPQPRQWVQVIIFRSLDRQAGKHERWEHELPPGISLTGVNLGRPPHLPSGFHPTTLGPTMRRVWSILQGSALYHPMLKLAWVQPAYPMGSAIPVSLAEHSGREITVPPTEIPVHNVHRPRTGRSHATALADRTRFRILGTAQITVMRHTYIEIHALLVKRNRRVNLHPGSIRSTGITRPGHLQYHHFTIYPINQANQFRQGRVSYFDNPVYGILVYVKPVSVSSQVNPLSAGG